MAGEEAPEVGPKESADKTLRVPELRVFLLGVSGVLPLTTGSLVGGWSPFWTTGPGLAIPLLARPGLEIEPWPAVFIGALSPFPEAGGLLAGLRGPDPALRAGAP